MITYLKRDITTVEFGIIMQGVNTRGVMGSGVALAIRNKWPVVYDEYKKQPTGKHMLGYVNMVYINDILYVANCFTQEYFGKDGRKYASVSAVAECLESCITYATALVLPLYMPKIGSGLGGLNWSLDVEPIVNNLSEKNNIDIFVCDI